MEPVLEENRAALKSLIDQVPHGIVPLVGAGMSRPYYPVWSKFLLDQAKNSPLHSQIRTLLRQNQYEEAAESLLVTLGDHRFQEIVKDTFGPEKLPQAKDIPASLRDLVALGRGPVLTLNFDPVLEYVFRECGAAFHREIWGAQVDTFNEALDQNLHYLLKVHGHYADRTNRVLTRSDYENRYGVSSQEGRRQGPLLPRLLERFVVGGRLLFLGCSLNQDRWVDILKDAHERYNHNVGWAIVERPATGKAFMARDQFLSARGIKPIWFEKGEYGCIEIILRYVVSKSVEVSPVARDGWGEIADRTESLIRESCLPLAGREASMAALDEYVTSDLRKPIIVSAPAGFGKTALLARWTADQRQNRRAVACHFFSEQHGLTSLSDAYLNLLHQIDEFSGDVKRRKRSSPETELRGELYEAVNALSPNGSEHLTILIDALDECEANFDPPFPSPLPRGVSVVVSARGSKWEVEERLQSWTRDYEPLVLSTLPRDVIRVWLRQAGSGELAGLAEDDSFVDRLWARTEGFPLYLRHLIEELVRLKREGGDVNALSDGTPRGFSDYVADRAKKLKSSDALAEKRNQMVLAMLAVAVGMMPEDDLATVLTGTTILDLQRLPWTLTRWLSVQSDAEGTLLYGFAHPLLAHEFRVTLRSMASEAERLLLDHCSRWQKHASSYALRYYARQLYEAGRWDELFVLARNVTFEQAQQRFASEEMDLPLRTVQLALKGASKSGNTASTAEFLLLHSSRRDRLLGESPLDALRQGNLKRACRLADFNDIDTCTLWRLLLAWEAAATDQVADARDILTDLAQKKLARLSSWKERYAARLLAELVNVDTELCIELQKSLLADDARALLCQQLIRRGDVAPARTIAMNFYFVDFGLAWVESEIALMHAAKDEYALALESLDEAVALSFKFRPGHLSLDNMNLMSRFNDLIANTIGAIASAQATSGLIGPARQTLARISRLENEISGLCRIATALRLSGDRGSGQKFLEEAAAGLEQLSQGWELDSALAALSEAQANCEYIGEALETAKKIEGDDQRTRSLAVVAGAQAREGDRRSAKKIAEETEDPRARMVILKAIAAGSAKTGEFEAARAIAAEITFDEIHDDALSEIAGIQSVAGEFREAFDTVEQMRGSLWVDRESSLLQIAFEQFRAGDANDARSTIANAIICGSARNRQGVTSEVDELFLEAVTAHASLADWSTAEATAQKIVDEVRRSRALTTIAREQFRLGYHNLAHVSVTSAIEAAGQAGKFKDHLLSAIAQEQAKGGEFESALRTMSLVQSPFERVLGLGQIGVDAAAAGNHARAEEIFTNAQHEIAKVEEIRASASLDLVRCLLRARSFAAAIAVTLEIGAMAIRAAEVDEDLTDQVAAINHQATALREVVSALVEAGLYDEARALVARVDEFLNEIGKRKFMLMNHAQEHTLEAIAACHAMLADFTSAFQATARIGSFSSRALSKARALAEIAVMQASKGQPEEARETLMAALAAAKSNQKSDVFSCEEAIGEIAVRFARIGDVEASREAVECISDPQRKAPTLSRIAGVIAGRREKDASILFADAAASAEAIKDPYARASTMKDIAVEQARSGLGEAAVRTSARILTSRSSLLPQVADALFAAKDIEHFTELFVPCSYYKESALKMCGLLIRLVPQQAALITELADRA